MVNVERDARVEVWHMEGHGVDLAKERLRHRDTLVDCAHPSLGIERVFPNAGYGTLSRRR